MTPAAPGPDAAVEAVLDALWRRKDAASANGRAAAPDETRTAPGPADPVTVRRLSQQFGEQAMECVSAAMRGDRAGLVHTSAVLFESLFAIWAGTGLQPPEVWIELHKREQLGTLLMQMNQAQGRLPRRVLKPWRVDSTKLP